LTSEIEHDFFNYLIRDPVAHFYALMDLRFLRDKSRFWVAGKPDICGYLLEFDKRILVLRGASSYARQLLEKSRLSNPHINTEPEHLPAIRDLYRICGRPVPFIAMRTDKNRFSPRFTHDTTELNRKNLSFLEDLHPGVCGQLQFVAEKVPDFVVYTAFVDGAPVSFAAGCIVEGVSGVLGLSTSTDFRRKGFAISVCSALVQRLLSASREALLFVKGDNTPAIRLYESLGFDRTRHIFLKLNTKKEVSPGCPSSGGRPYEAMG
jgi:GNAT superfamily N-acetyltransferase